MKTSGSPLRSTIAASAVIAALIATDLHARPPQDRDRHSVQAGISLGFALPNGFLELTVGHDRYYTHRGVFYHHGPDGLIVVRAPRGAIVRELPPNSIRIYVGNVVYYRYADVYYRPAPKGYIVVDPPEISHVPPPAPAEEIQSVWVGTTEYVFKNGQFFRKTAEGLVWIEAPLGALTRTLPPDASSVWYQDIEYFECAGVFFRKTPDGYRVVAAPWKK